ncbi:MAG: IS66 family transposase [Acidobacteriota bacterium]|nr:IS66 family transposase [Acidobacteriota bacterium]
MPTAKFAVWEPPTPDQLQLAIDHLHEEIDRLRSRIARLEEEVRAERHQNFVLSGKVRELEARLAKNSTNSSLPPSTDPPAAKKTKSLRQQSDRKIGGQPAHPGTTLKPVAQPDQVLVHRPAQCRGCGESLAESKVIARGSRQVFDLPPVKLHVVEHQVETKHCAKCGHWTSALFPHGVDAPAQYGPGVRARAVYLLNYQLIPYQRASEVMKDLFGCPLSPATLANIVKECAEHLIESELEIKDQLRRADLIHADETGVRVDEKQHWIHVASTEKLTHYGVDGKRGAAAIDRIDILPRVRGTCVHDGWWAYGQYTKADHALCNAHIVRELNFFIEHEAKQKPWTQEMKDLLLGIKEEADKVRAAGRKKIAPEKIRHFEQEYDEIISRGLAVNPHLEDPAKGILSYEEGDGTAAPQLTKRTPALNLVLRLRRNKKEVLHFMYDLKVPFTNNQAERDLRMAKLQQKISGCFRVPDGARFFCRLRSYISTMRKQGQEVVAALEKVFATPMLHQPPRE